MNDAWYDPPSCPEPPGFAGECAAYVGDDVEVIVAFDRDGEITWFSVGRPWVLSAEDWQSIADELERATGPEALAERAYDDWYSTQEARADAMRDDR